MINIESLKDYKENKEFIEIAQKIYAITESICNDYPNYKEWYFTKQLPDTINSNERNILFVRNCNEIIAMCCLKKDESEQKICTLYVIDKYRHLEIGSALIEESMKWLKTTKPFITIPDYKLEMFKSIINKYDWKLTEIIPNLYNNNSQELCFNGVLSKKLIK